MKKFVLATALFALPLAFILIVGLIEHNRTIIELEQKRTAMQRVQELDKIAQKAASMRNNNVLSVLLPNVVGKSNLKSESETILELLAAFSKKDLVKQSNLIQLYINNVEAQATADSARGGSEGDTVHTAFSKFNKIMSQIHRLTILLLTEGASYNDRDVFVLNAISLLVNDFNKPLEYMGEAETLGAFFLEKGFIDTKGILSLTNITRQLEESFSLLSRQLEFLFEKSEAANKTRVVEVSLLEGIPLSMALLEDTVIFDDELLTSQEIYRFAMQKESAKVFLLRSQVIQYVLLRYEQRIEQSKQQQWERMLMIGGLLSLALYLFLGIFFSVEDSLKKLIQFAERIEGGDLGTNISLNTRDEFYQLANVFEKMRLRLRVRDQELFDLTITDGLTGIYNRKHFNESIDKCIHHTIRSDEPLSILLIDIDFFKKFNDEHGHQVGDSCLVHVGKILRNVLERKTDKAFRYGGEEFAILLPHTDKSGASIMAKKVWGAIRSSVLVLGEKHLDITASIGVACTNDLENADAEALIMLADNALYKAKEEGRDRYVTA